MAVDETAWERLPHDPVGFFGLRDGFDRKELKRAYGQLIRVYKPETHPAEFQRIRDVYELLETNLRYGTAQKIESERVSAWERSSRAANSTLATPAANSDLPTTSSAAPVPEACEDPVGHYKHLMAIQRKSPQDFFTLAILSDVVDSADSQRFLKWLLTGLKQYPEDPGLLRLLREHLTSDVDVGSANSILLTLSKIVPAHVFFPVSESLWGRVFRDMSFESYSRLLEACETNLKQRTTVHHLIFYIHGLKQMVWTANGDWIQEKWKTIQSHGSEIPAGFDQDIEFLQWLMEYMKTDRKRIGANAIRKMVDDMLRAYCVEPWLVAAGKIAQVQDEIARSSIGFMDAFPAAKSEEDHRLLLLLQMVTWESLEQAGMSLSDRKSETLSRQSDLAVADLCNDSEGVSNRIAWMQLRTTWLPLLLVAFVPLLFAWGFIDGSILFVVGLGWIALVAVLYFVVLKRFVVNPWITSKVNAICVDSYENTWRPRIFRYVQACRVSPGVAIESLRESAFHTGSSKLIDVILSYTVNDMGLRAFHLAQCFVH